jgi:hypothetical protein
MLPLRARVARSPGRFPAVESFFLPAGQECDVSLHAPLDAIHIYLRAELFDEQHIRYPGALSELTPLIGERDAVPEHLASAIGQAVRDNLLNSSLFVDPIAQAMASRLLAIDGCRNAGKNVHAIPIVSPQGSSNRYVSLLKQTLMRTSG